MWENGHKAETYTLHEHNQDQKQEKWEAIWYKKIEEGSHLL